MSHAWRRTVEGGGIVALARHADQSVGSGLAAAPNGEKSLSTFTGSTSVATAEPLGQQAAHRVSKAKLRRRCDRTALITITTSWAEGLDIETRMPSAVE